MKKIPFNIRWSRTKPERNESLLSMRLSQSFKEDCTLQFWTQGNPNAAPHRDPQRVFPTIPLGYHSLGECPRPFKSAVKYLDMFLLLRARRQEFLDSHPLDTEWSFVWADYGSHTIHISLHTSLRIPTSSTPEVLRDQFRFFLSHDFGIPYAYPIFPSFREDLWYAIVREGVVLDPQVMLDQDTLQKVLRVSSSNISQALELIASVAGKNA